MGDLKARGIHLTGLEERLDTSSAVGKLVFHVFGAIAHLERRLIAKRTRDGVAGARKRGRSPGRPPLDPQTESGAQKLIERRQVANRRVHQVNGGIRPHLGVVRAGPNVGAEGAGVLGEPSRPHRDPSPPDQPAAHAPDLRGLEQTLVEIGEDDGRTLLTGLLARSDAPSLAHFVRSKVGMDRAAAQEVFSEFLSNRSLTTPQIRFIEMVIEQLTARGVMEPSALYEAPFSSVHAGGPEALFAGKSNVIEGIFEKLEALHPEPLADAG